MPGITVGVDVGGTKILAAVVDDQAVVVADGDKPNPESWIVATAKQESPQDSTDAMMEAILTTIQMALDEASLSAKKIDGIGLGVPGVVGPSGECIWAPNCPLTGVAVADKVRERFGVPVAVGNDVNVGTLGEKAFGAGRGYQNVFGIFVGTGIGGGLVIDGKVVVGDHCLGAEIGHMIVDWDAAARGDEGGGEFEYYASRLGIERQVRQAVSEGRESRLAEVAQDADDRLRSGALKKAIAKQDEVAVEVLSRCAEQLGIGTVNVIHLCDPEAIIFGGGVIEACADFMLPRIKEAIAQHVAPGNGKPIVVVESQLGDYAVLLGAVALVKGLGPASDDTYPRLQANEFGEVTVGGERKDYDVVVRANGKVKKRKKKLSRQVHGTAHEISEREIEYVCKGEPKVVIIGAGHHGQMSLSRDAHAWLNARSIRVMILPTPDAAAAFNQTAGPKALLLHVAC